MKNPIAITVVVAIIVGALAFFGGMQYQKMQRGNFAAGGRSGNFALNGGPRGSGAPGQRGGQGFRPVTGEITAADANSITVKLDDGSSKIVLINDSTPINKTDPGTKTDLTVGTKVGVFGSDNNGTVTATNIQINPMQMRFGGPNASASPMAQ